MRFTVTWSATAHDLLASIWLKLLPGERSAFSERVNWLDRTLRENAHQKGVEVITDPSIRVLSPPEFFEPPTIGVAYTVSVADRTVEVLKLYELPNAPR